MIECHGIAKYYAKQCVINSFSYKFANKGFYLIIGESGSGKTTFLNILSGLTTFDAGTLTINNTRYRDHVKVEEVAHCIEYVTQDSYFIPFLSVFDNLKLVTSDEMRIFCLLQQYQMSSIANQYPTTLSGGERQRVAIIRALLKGKTILLLDEPTASLDEENKIAVYHMIDNIKNDLLVICSSHDSQAIPFADSIIQFPQVDPSPEKNIFLSEEGTCPQSTYVYKSIDYKPPKAARPYLKKWFASKYRSRCSSILFSNFLVLSFCLCMFSDTPSNKEHRTISDIYKSNTILLVTYGYQDISQYVNDPAVATYVLEYAPSCPDGNENLSPDVIMRPLPEYEVSLNTLPYSSSVFPLANKIQYGTYFREWNDIILSSEMAESLNPQNPSELIGTSIEKSIYSMGNIKFRIVGIFEKFSDFDKKYLETLDITIAPDNDYNSDNYTDLYFINSEFTNLLIDNQGFYSGNNMRRSYRLYFKDYNDALLFYNNYHSTDDIVIENPATYLGLYNSFKLLFFITFPTAVLMSLFTTLFYISLRKIEFAQNAQFIAVFEYAGYSKSAVIKQFAIQNIIVLCKQITISLICSFVIANIVNYANTKYFWVNFSIFTFNYSFICAFSIFIIVTSILLITILFVKVKVKSWYEILLQSRDLL